jgi:outer membrane receptor for ferrienterochelin and colicins
VRLVDVVFVLSLLGCPEPLLAAQPATSPLNGTVHDSSGQVVPSATVVVEVPGSAFSRIVETGRDGRFILDGLAVATYRVTVIAAGFAAEGVMVTLPAPDLAVTLRPAPVVEEVSVVSVDRQEQLRQHLNTRVDVISRARIDDTGAETVAEVLRDLPGVLTRRGSETAGQAGQQIQGIDSRQVLVLLDGQPVPAARGIKRGIVNLDRQSIGRLDRIEVVKGASSALYGSDAIGGVINLITRDAAAPFDLSASISGGSFGDVNARAEAGVRRRGWSALFVGERHHHDGFDLTPTTFDTTGAPFRRTDALAKVSVRANDAFTLAGMMTGYVNDAAGRSNGELGPQEDDIDDHTVSVGLNADWLLRPTVTLAARAYTSRYDERSTARLAPPASTPLEPGSLEENVTKMDVSLSAVLGARQQLQGGLEYWDNAYAGINRIAFDEGVSASTAVAWAQHRLSIADRLTTTLGVRVDRHSAFGSAVSPKVAASLRIVEGLHARASFGSGFRAPDLGQLYYRFLNPSSVYQVIGNPDLEPERARSVQVGADWLSKSRRARVGLNIFHNDVDDLIESVNLGMVVTPAQLAALLAREGLDSSFRPVLGRLLFTYKNVNDAVTQGTELDSELAVTPWLTLGAAYTYLDARDSATDRELTGRHPHQAHLRVTGRSDRLGLRATLRATSYSSWIAARAGANDTVAPGFTLWDISATQRLVRGLVGFAAVDNLTDNQDPNTGVTTAAGLPATIYRPEIGRTLRIGVRWAWSK